MPSYRKAKIAAADEALLAELGYKQEFQRAFTPLEVSIIFIISYWSVQLINISTGFRNSIQYHWLVTFYCVRSSRIPTSPRRVTQTEFELDDSSVLFYAIPNGGPSAMVWGVSSFFN